MHGIYKLLFSLSLFYELTQTTDIQKQTQSHIL